MVTSEDFTVMDFLKTYPIENAEIFTEFNARLVLDFSLLMVGPYGICANSKADLRNIALRFDVLIMAYFKVDYFETPHSDMLTLHSAMEKKFEECLDGSQLMEGKHFLTYVVGIIFSSTMGFTNMVYNVLVGHTLYRNYARKAASDTFESVLTKSEQFVRGIKLDIHREHNHTFESWQSEVRNIMQSIPESRHSLQHLQQ